MKKIFFLSIIFFFSACTRTLEFPDLGEIYNKSAKYHGVDRNPVIVIPGILGSKLKQKDSEKVVWGTFTGEFADPSSAENVRLLSLPMKPGAQIAELTDDVEPNGVLDRIKVEVLGVPVEVTAYLDILESLGAGGYKDEDLGIAGAIDYGSDHYTCFQFAYDWRRDIVESAHKLHEFILEKREFVKKQHQKRFGPEVGDIKFDIVAHSMGGLVLRYYLRYGTQDLPEDGSLPELTWEGAKNIDKVVIVATPSAGSIESLFKLIGGIDYGYPLPKYPASILGTYATLYQLLPRPRHGMILDSQTKEKVDLYDPSLWQKMGWGLADPEEADVIAQILPDVSSADERKVIALDHQAKMLARARHLHQALDVPAETPENLRLVLFAGDAAITDAEVHLDRSKKELIKKKGGPGDTVVLRSSALMDERIGNDWKPQLVTPIDWDRVHFIFKDHIGMTKDPGFTDNLLFYLLES